MAPVGPPPLGVSVLRTWEQAAWGPDGAGIGATQHVLRRGTSTRDRHLGPTEKGVVGGQLL